MKESVHSTCEINQGEPPVSAEEMRAQLEKVLISDAFASAITLQKLLRYIGEKTIEGLSSEIKEYVIGRELFGRKADFDPKVDTAVRVYVHRLREKVEAYYQDEGREDEIHLEIPKGHYAVCFSRRVLEISHNPADGEASDAGVEGSESTENGDLAQPSASTSSIFTGKPRHTTWERLPLAVTSILLLASGVFVLWYLLTPAPGQEKMAFPASNPSQIQTSSLLAEFWAPFLKARATPLVTFSNAVFLVTQTSDLLRLKGKTVDALGASAAPDMARRLVENPSLLSQAGPVFFEDVYTGTGEVMAVYNLTQMFDHFHRSIQVERSRLVSIDDLRAHDVVFLGSTREDDLLAGLPAGEDYVFEWPEKHTSVWDGKILNLHPRSGERSMFGVELDPKTGTLLADYALVSVLPGIIPGRKVVVLGGLTTLGTQGAAELATSAEGVAQILAHLGRTGPNAHGKLAPYFQAVLKVKVMKGEVLSTRCIEGHVIHTGPADSARGGS